MVFCTSFPYVEVMSTQSFSEAIEEAKSVIRRFEKIEGKPWGVEGAVIELAKQVGQLSALVMNREGYYFPEREKASAAYVATDERIADELADIMLAVVRIADYYGIELESAIQKTRVEEDKALNEKGV